MWSSSCCAKLYQKYNVSHCLLYWNQGIVYCTCGQCLINSESRRKFNKLRLDALSIPNHVIKKGLPHGARHGPRTASRHFTDASFRRHDNTWSSGRGRRNTEQRRCDRGHRPSVKVSKRYYKEEGEVECPDVRLHDAFFLLLVDNGSATSRCDRRTTSK